MGVWPLLALLHTSAAAPLAPGLVCCLIAVANRASTVRVANRSGWAKRWAKRTAARHAHAAPRTSPSSPEGVGTSACMVFFWPKSSSSPPLQEQHRMHHHCMAWPYFGRCPQELPPHLNSNATRTMPEKGLSRGLPEVVSCCQAGDTAAKFWPPAGLYFTLFSACYSCESSGQQCR